MNAEVVRLCEAVREAGGRAMLVGGSVRDQLLGIESKDFDVEVYGLEPAHLRRILAHIGQVNTVGEHFSVYKVVFYPSRTCDSEGLPLSAEPAPEERFEIDVSLPRRESKSGSGHRGFVIDGDPAMSFEEAARRRDFTINAILCDPLTGETVDPYGGREDLTQRILRAVAADTFIEDSLRVLRAVQLAARFEMTIEPQTIALCRTIELSDLPRERIWGEIEKLLTLAERPSIGLDAALQLGVFDKLFPELQALISRQDGDNPKPENPLTHTKLALDEAVELVGDLPKPKRIAVLLAALCHELGNATPTLVAGNTASPEHEKAGREATRSVLNKLGLFGIASYDVRSQVLALVTAHLKPCEFYDSRESTSDGDFRRLAQRVDLDLLYRVAKACSIGRGSARSTVAEDWFIERARALGVEHGPPAPFLQGRHLVEAGFEPGPQMGRLLRGVYELQLDGEVTTLEEALMVALRIAPAPPKLFR
ncbi:MAG: polynucleotide adenylyltransferase [Acidobacteriota bacterium]